MMTETVHIILSAVSILVSGGLLGLMWKFMKWLTTHENMHRTHPNHKHINGLIDYPPGYKPESPEELNPERAH